MIAKVLLTIISILLAGTSLVAAQDESLQATLYQTVNLRSGPDTRFEIVGQLTAGDTVRVTGRASDDSRWLRVELPDATVGWAPSYLLLFEGEVTELPVVGDTPTGGSETADMVMVTAYGTVNVRQGPSIVEEIIGQLDSGDQARALARSNERNDWLYIQSTALAGWVAYFTVDVQGDPRILPLRVPDVATDELVHPRELISTLFNVRLRAEPTLDADEVGVLDFGTEVTAFAREEAAEWIYVGTEDLRGWGVAELFDINAEHLEELPLFDENAVYELLTPDTGAPDAQPEDVAPAPTLPTLPTVEATETAEPTEAVEATEAA